MSIVSFIPNEDSCFRRNDIYVSDTQGFFILNNTKIHHNEFIELIENKNTALLEFEKMKIHNLLMSHSWRITSPFRTVKKFLEQFIFNNFMK